MREQGDIIEKTMESRAAGQEKTDKKLFFTLKIEQNSCYMTQMCAIQMECMWGGAVAKKLS